MNDYMNGLSHHLTDLEIADIETLFGSDPAIAILVDGTAKDRRRRAERRKATAHKHQRTEIIMDVYGVKPEYRKHGKKVLQVIHEERMYNHGNRDLSRQIIRETKTEALYEERRTAFYKAVDQWRHDDALRCLAERMIESLDAQEDPDNRIIVEAWLDDGIISIRSNCDGWAEDVKPFILLEPGDTITPEDLVGLTESQAKHLYEMDQCGFDIDLIDDEEFIF